MINRNKSETYESRKTTKMRAGEGETKHENARALPKTEKEIKNGGVYRQLVRCGKSNCKCATKQEKHTAYYFFYREQGKLKKIYIRKAGLKEFKKIADKARKERFKQREQYIRSRDLVRMLRTLEKEKTRRLRENLWWNLMPKFYSIFEELN